MNDIVPVNWLASLHVARTVATTVPLGLDAGVTGMLGDTVSVKLGGGGGGNGAEHDTVAPAALHVHVQLLPL